MRTHAPSIELGYVAGWLESVGGQVIATDAPELADWFVRHGIAWALRRPDFVVYGTAGDAEGADAMLSDRLGRLGRPVATVELGSTEGSTS